MSRNILLVLIRFLRAPQVLVFRYIYSLVSVDPVYPNRMYGRGRYPHTVPSSLPWSYTLLTTISRGIVAGLSFFFFFLGGMGVGRDSPSLSRSENKSYSLRSGVVYGVEFTVGISMERQQGFLGKEKRSARPHERASAHNQ